MTLGTAAEEIKKSEEIWGSSSVKALRAQQEQDFGLWGPYRFSMPKDEGKWEDVTTNSATVLGNKIIGLLSSSWLQLFIDVDDEQRKGRAKISKSEQLANGCIWVADREAISVPSGKKLQSALSTHAVLRGGTAKSVYWYIEEDKPVCDIKPYDPMFCQWIEGERELLWFCYRNYVSKNFLEHTYGEKKAYALGSGLSNSDNNVLTYTFWDDMKWKVAVNGEYIDEGEHGLGYIPVNVRSCGATPYLQSAEYRDTMNWSWQSCYANNRDIYGLESKLLSIESSKAIESGKIKLAGEWDSVKSGNQLPQGIDKLGYGAPTRNELVLFDAAKGQKFGGMVQPPGNEVIDQFLTRIRGMDVIGSIDPIAFGQMTRSGSGALAAELRSAALEFINPFRECVENDFIWVAEECVKQFKNGQYDKVSVEGRGRKREKFYANISPSDVEEKHFDCELVADRLRDEIQELGAAIQKVSYGLSSRKTAMVKHNLVDDPDREMDIMDEELAAQDPVLKYDKLAKYFSDQGDDRMAQYYMALSAITIENMVKQSMMAQLMPPEETTGKPPIVSPQMQTRQIASQPGNLRDMGY
uniref:Portal protein n=1 Tax=viral metagenome TaxID=1070528 RepID=A0A6M3K297_9ZZZZ